MTEFTTYIFERSKKKTLKRFIYNLAIISAIGGVIYMYIAGILGIGLSIIG